MKDSKALVSSALTLLLWLLATATFASPKDLPRLVWTTVVDNGYTIPGTDRTFNSYNEPSVNAKGLVVFRARSQGGGTTGMATQGVYTRDMSTSGSEVRRIFDRTTLVPAPNNLGTDFGEPPSFPRIDRSAKTIVSRANHQPVWSYTPAGASDETRTGTNGIYADPYGVLITAASKLGAVPGYEYFSVPGFDRPIFFDVFPGAPAVTNGSTVVFKGNFSVEGVAETGVYYRHLSNEETGGTTPVKPLADTLTNIPGTVQAFGSVSPPSAAGNYVVFTGFDDEQNPNLGGIYLAPLISEPPLTPLVEIGAQVPGEKKHAKFTSFGEGLSFDGQNVGFWGAWGKETRMVRLYCPEEGNKARIAYCNHSGQFSGDKGDPNTEFDPQSGRWYQEVEVPVHQGIFVHNVKSGRTVALAKTGDDFYDFLYWTYSGRVPGVGEGDEGDDGELIRWRSSAYVAVSGPGKAPFKTVFKGTRRDGVLGLYLVEPGRQGILTLLDTTTAGQDLDPAAPDGSLVTELGLERDSFRNGWLAISARMGVEGESEEEGMAGIYLTRMPANFIKDRQKKSQRRGPFRFAAREFSGFHALK